jgi:hypothetical protein
MTEVCATRDSPCRRFSPHVTLTNTSSEQRIFDPLPISLIFGSLDDSTGDIAGVANFTTTNTSGISDSDVSFTAHSVTFQLGSSIWAASGGTASFNLVISPVTEPTSVTLLGIAFGVLGLSLWPGKRGNTVGIVVREA